MIVKQNLPRVLVCDDDKNIHLALKSALGKEYDIKSAYNGDEARAILKSNTMEIVLMDMEMRTPTEGLDTIPKLIEIQPEVIVIFFSGKTDFQYVRNAMKNGAYDYVPKDSGAEELRHVFSKALETRKLKTQKRQAQREIKTANKHNVIIGKSAAIEKIKKQIERARVSPAPIVIFGETGTGKEVVARLLRKTSPDGSLEPFVAVDSGTFQSSVSESVLFGYEKGAFTGAEKTTRGLFEEANEGVIYFDELANMPLEIQNKLLRVIQEKEVLRIGSSRPISLDFRVICATNQDLDKLVAEGKFKDDLYQRMNVLQIQIPPLRERTEDIPLLLEHYSDTLSNGLPKIQFLPETIEVIQRYPFPGNIRELVNLIQYLYSMSEETQISPLDLPPKFHKSASAPAGASAQGHSPVFADSFSEKNFYKRVEQFEKGFLEQEYKRLDGNVSKMSAELGMDRSYLHSKLKNYGIHTTRK
jgi:two-component system nitrogen regulation response regulator NtrX